MDSHHQGATSDKRLETAASSAQIELVPATIVELQPTITINSAPALVDVAKVKVLVAEDNGISQRAIKATLEKLGCEVAIAINGRDVIEKLKRDSYALILMDTQMPQVDGLQATEQIRAGEASQQAPQLPIFGMSAHIDEPLRARCLRSGMNDLLSKPLHEARLEQVLSGFRPDKIN
jgi:CheY-like chemotaxis protein